MRRIILNQFGDAQELQLADMNVPVPEADQVLIRVAGAGVNPIDWKTRKGLGFVAQQITDRLPWTPGYDISGVVETIGDSVTTLTPGDRVMGVVGFPTGGGGYADYTIARADEVIQVPEELELVNAGALPLAALTAWQGLFEIGQLQPDHKVLIHAGAGGVGHLAVQFARAHGAHVIATASAGNADFLDTLGADEIIDYHGDDFVDACYGLDLVLDLVGGETGKRSLHTLSKQGVLVTVPTVTADSIVTAAEDMGLRAHGMTMRPDTFHLDEIAELIEDGDVRLHVEQTYPLSEAAAAHEASEAGHGRGKLVLDCRL